MKISRLWLQKYFKDELPSAAVLRDALTFHAFEIDGIDQVGEDEVLDVKVTPNRGHDALSHRAIAKELAAILKLPITSDPLAQKPTLGEKTDVISVSVADSKLCPRYIAGVLTGVTVGPSPEWLKNRLAAIGQRSINNIVDATNFVMFNIGQPLHAFDAAKLTQKDGRYSIAVRTATAGEQMAALDQNTYAFTDSMLLIADGASGTPLGIAGIKGGVASGISESTKNIIIEAANFDGVSVRKTARALKLRTDASQRFEQVISPELALYGMRAVVELIQKLAGGVVAGFVDVYPQPVASTKVSVDTELVTNILGSTFTRESIIDAFTRLGFIYSEVNGVFTVEVPFERLDLTIPEDLVEEVGRIAGYEHVPATPLPSIDQIPLPNESFMWSERVRTFLVNQGFSEVFTSVFTDKGERVVLNKIDGVRPFLRDSIRPALEEALTRNIKNKDLLGVKQVRLFEIGTIWKGGVESIVVELAVEKVKGEKSEAEYRAMLDAYLAMPSEEVTLDISGTKRYVPYSKYPFVVRDIALWVPKGTEALAVERLIRENAGALLLRLSLFDQFEKEGKISFAFRLIFQSFEKTLNDEEVNACMEHVTNALVQVGYQVR